MSRKDLHRKPGGESALPLNTAFQLTDDLQVHFMFVYVCSVHFLTLFLRTLCAKNKHQVRKKTNEETFQACIRLMN